MSQKPVNEMTFDPVSARTPMIPSGSPTEPQVIFHPVIRNPVFPSVP